MDRWAPLTPSRPGESLTARLKATALSTSSHPYTISGVLPPPLRAPPPKLGAWIGPLPESLHLLVIAALPVSELPKVARVSRAFGRLVSSDEAWEGRWQALGLRDETVITPPPLTSSDPAFSNSSTLPINFPSHGPKSSASGFADFSASARTPASPPLDEFGDFVNVPVNEAGGGATGGQQSLMEFDKPVPLPSNRAATGGRSNGFFAFSPVKTTESQMPSSSSAVRKPKRPYRKLYQAYHTSLMPNLQPLMTIPAPSPSQTLSLLFPASLSSTPAAAVLQSAVLVSLLTFLTPQVQPLDRWKVIRQSVLAAADRFDAACLIGFEGADEKGDEAAMKLWASAGWNVWVLATSGSGSTGLQRRRVEEWEVGRVWIERRELFYEGGSMWDPLKNILTPPMVPEAQLNFTPMDAFISHVEAAIASSGELAMRVFPPTSQVLRMFTERVISDVIGESYVQPLLERARESGLDIFLRASAAVYAVTGRIVEAVEKAGGGSVQSKEVEDLIFKMFEFNMDEYLDEEIDWVKASMNKICKEWDIRLKNDSSQSQGPGTATTTFLTSQNPALVKKNVLAGFRDVLLLPVTIIPRTAVYVVSAGSNAAVSGFSMLNPSKWQGSSSNTTAKSQVVAEAYSKHGEPDPTVFELGDEDDLLPPTAVSSSTNASKTTLAVPSSTTAPIPSASRLAMPSNGRSTSTTAAPSRAITPAPKETFESLQLLISLDTALELIHADREALKRVETFKRYPGRVGERVHETIEEVFIMLLQAMADRHIGPGFRLATEQMRTYKPAEHEEATSVAPLLQFFELVHVGDTIQSMVQVYFDKEMVPHIDRTDFLNSVVREKKRFENVLDEAVAAGLNAGIEVLMDQVEYIITSRTGPREYYPMEGVDMDLGPTRGCREAVASLEMHCNLLKGSTSKDVLEVFYQEVGIRLQSIIQKHLKRQIISLQGGFQIISDLNTYHAFVSSLKQPRVTDDFSNLKMLGHVFIVEDAKDLAQIVRDVTRYGGTFRPEDVYEFIQRRSDWKRIEKTVDNAMYSLSLKEDCVIC